MKEYRDSMEEIMSKSGFANTLSKIVALRGPLNYRYEGTWYKHIYLLYTAWVELLLVIDLISVALYFFRPGIDVIERCFTGFPLFSLSLATSRVAYFFVRRKRFVKLMVEYDNLYKGNPQLNNDIARNARLTRIVLRILMFLTAASMTPWCLMPVYNSIRGGEWGPAVPSVWPFDPSRNLLTFIIPITVQTLGAGYTCTRVVLFDNIFYVYACRQLALSAHLSRELTRIISPVQVQQNGQPIYHDAVKGHTSKAEASLNMQIELKQWIINHQHSLRLAKELNDLYSPALLCQYSLLSITLCTIAVFVGYSDADYFNMFLCGLYAVGNSLELLITCRIGDFITQESDKLERLTIGCHIYVLDNYVYKYWVKMILTRSNIPIRLSALGVFPLNTGTFKDIMVTTYSFFTLLKSMKERNL